MSDLRPTSPVVDLRGVGPRRAEALRRAGFHTVADLLYHLPHRYEDRRRRLRISEIDRPGRAMLQGRIVDVRRVRVRRRNFSLVRARVVDDTGDLDAIWFNQPYLVDQLDENREYALYGEIRSRERHFELVNASCEPACSARDCGRILPVYPAVGGIGPSLLRRLMGQLLERLDLNLIEDPLPAFLRARYDLPELKQALAELHVPSDDRDLRMLEQRSTSAHARLSYGELLELQIELGLLRELEVRRPKRHGYRFDRELHETLRGLLPFELTDAQQRVLEEISHDLGSPYPMLRLLQGDVGSGKTIVAALALALALESGLQAALMAPTELLAEQHFDTLRRLYGERYCIGLLTSSVSDAAATRRSVTRGDTQLLIGTHALVQEGLEFDRLGLGVIDEQHRFGVAQRRVLQLKGDQPDLLVMTATPIPRSLALTVYGDLALSVIDELPPGRKPVSTRLVPARRRREVYEWLVRELDQGAQAYVVFPLIEESDHLGAESISTMGERVRELLGEHSSAVLHGRIPVHEREVQMRRFHRGELRVLIATTLIEVGVDVRDATVMIIESSERFGLAQLHQLRGRVGRGRQRAHCVAVHGRLTADARRRLEVFADTTDGFRIAEADLQIRGPGDLLGTRQSGQPLLRVADIIRDHEWLERARRDSRELIASAQPGAADPFLRTVGERARTRYESFAGG